jgi:hypothetical protein
VTFAMVAMEFAEASQVVKIISGEIEPLDARTAKSSWSIAFIWNSCCGGDV